MSFLSYSTLRPNLLVCVKQRRPHSKVAHPHAVDLNELVPELLVQMTLICLILLLILQVHLVRICSRLLQDEGLIRVVSQQVRREMVKWLRLLELHLGRWH